MIIKSLSGKTLYQSNQKTMKSALEEGIGRGIDFTNGDFRAAKLSKSNLDSLVAPYASFWSADLEGADLGLADLKCADLRCATLKDTCLAQTALTGADLRGAYFSRTLVEGAVLDRITASCPSFWSLDFASAASFKGAVFSHLGEVDILLETLPIIMGCHGQRLVISRNHCVWGGGIYAGGPIPALLEERLLGLRITLEKILKSNISHSAIKPIPKTRSEMLGV